MLYLVNNVYIERVKQELYNSIKQLEDVFRKYGIDYTVLFQNNTLHIVFNLDDVYKNVCDEFSKYGVKCIRGRDYTAFIYETDMGDPKPYLEWLINSIPLVLHPDFDVKAVDNKTIVMAIIYDNDLVNAMRSKVTASGVVVNVELIRAGNVYVYFRISPQ